MAFRQFLSFFRGAATYIHADEQAIEQSGDLAGKYSTYHRRIVATAAIGSLAGAIFGVVIFAQFGGLPDDKHGGEMFLFPVIYGAIGLLLSTGIACLFAPTSFLKSPIGLKWMRLIGTENILVARLVCFTLGVLLPAGFATLVLLFPPKK